MHRDMVLESIRSCTLDELKAWKRHALFCLDFYKKERNVFEIEECEFILEHLDKQIALTASTLE